MRILLADDHADVRSLVAEVLRDQGHDVLVFEDGRQALDGASSQHVDVLITDFDMPGLDGVELCRKLRLSRPRLPAVLMSSRCGEAGWKPPQPMVCLAKPFRRQQLLDAINRALQPPGADAAEGPPAEADAPLFSPPLAKAHRASAWGLAAALLLVVGVGLMPSFLDRLGGPPALPEPVQQDVQRDATVQILAPAGVLAQLPDAAAWQAVPGADAYQLRFETVDGQMLFETRASAPPWSFPEALRNQLPANVAFHWQVEAFSTSGHLLARSTRTRFRVISPVDDLITSPLQP